jgi:hypothetical protein
MRRLRWILAAGGFVGGLALTGLVAAQDADRANPPPVPTGPAGDPAQVAPVAAPTLPAVKALANAVTPEEGPPPPKADTPPTEKLEAPPAEAPPPPEPLKRPRYAAAVIQAVDKLTAETLRFETKVGEPVRFKGLVLTVRACETTAADETTPDNIAFLDVQSQPLNTATAPRQVFRGWMFASSPSLHPFEHPIYDVWLIACKTTDPVVPAAIAPNLPPPPAKASAKRA